MNFEQEHGLVEADEQQKKMAELFSLLPQFCTLDEPVYMSNGELETNYLYEYHADKKGLDQNDLALLVDISKIKDKMSERQRNVYKLIWEENHTVPATAEMLNITIGQVISADRGIKRMFSQYKEQLKTAI